VSESIEDTTATIPVENEDVEVSVDKIQLNGDSSNPFDD
jgi:hypothetical protein